MSYKINKKLFKEIAYHNTHCRICDKERNSFDMIPCSFCGALCCENCMGIHEDKCEYSADLI